MSECDDHVILHLQVEPDAEQEDLNARAHRDCIALSNSSGRQSCFFSWAMAVWLKGRTLHWVSELYVHEPMLDRSASVLSKIGDGSSQEPQSTRSLGTLVQILI